MAGKFAWLGLIGALWAAPGSAQDYWQQKVGYTIEASLDEAAEVLRGSARVEYLNQSPERLDELFFHLYLNAFRPGSEWARTEAREEYDFKTLEDPDFGYERLTFAQVNGVSVELSYPHAPDSTVVRLALEETLRPGDSVTVELRWDARPSTTCRRQCRAGRHYDFAQWYPRIAVFDQEGWQAHALYPQGEFYGEYATYDVTLDVASDQVIGATGVPISGDPGWAPSETSPEQRVDYMRDWYGDEVVAADLDFLTAQVADGRKRVHFHSEDTHHFGLTISPDYLYEQGHFGDIAVRVLYREGDLDWDMGAAINRTARALEWLDGTMGPYLYPQITNVHRLEGGGTEFPMMIMNGGSGQGLITHETTHQYAHGMLGNNEWKEAWLDEGLTSFLTDWFTEEVGGVENPWAASIYRLAGFEQQNRTFPMSMASEEFPTFGVYGVMAYSKPSVVFFMLRSLVGYDVMREILQTYFDNFQLSHVNGTDFQVVAEAVSGEDLEWFFDQWVRSTASVDYGIASVNVVGDSESGFTTSVVVTRTGDGWMPVVIEVGDQRRVLTSRELLQAVEFETETRPTEVVLDPGTLLLESDKTNNWWQIG